MMRDGWTRMFDGIDVLAAPTVPMTAAKSGQDTVEWADGTVETVSDSYVRLSAPANITGVPALTLPVGHDHAGLPIGMQLMARPFGDATVLRVGQGVRGDGRRRGAGRPGGGLRVGGSPG